MKTYNNYGMAPGLSVAAVGMAVSDRMAQLANITATAASLLAALAIAAGLYLQMGLSLWVALMAALAATALLMGCHMLARHTFEVAATPGPMAPQRPNQVSAAVPPASEFMRHAEPARPAYGPAYGDDRPGGGLTGKLAKPALAPPPLPTAPRFDAMPPGPAHHTATWPAPAEPRGTLERGPPPIPARASALPPALPIARPAPEPEPSGIAWYDMPAADPVAMIPQTGGQTALRPAQQAIAAPDAAGPDLQGIIRQLAADVSAAAPARIQSAPGAAPVAAEPPPLPAASARRPIVAAPVAAAPAFDAERFDVCIEPIAGLVDRRANHYEVSIRLRGESGPAVARADYQSDLRQTGELAYLETLALPRIMRVARWLHERGRPSSVFSELSAESLADDAFLEVVAAEFAEATTPHLVLTFAQSEVRAFAAMHHDTLATMREIGIRFAIGDVTDLDMDFQELKTYGFDFVKLDAAVFLDGLPAAHHTIPSADLCRYLADVGMTAIVERIGDESLLARVFGFGVLLGQGTLFGAAKPVKADILEPARSAA